MEAFREEPFHKSTERTINEKMILEMSPTVYGREQFGNHSLEVHGTNLKALRL